jgi:DNA phosphorothioation-dependent restriction protein DptG
MKKVIIMEQKTITLSLPLKTIEEIERLANEQETTCEEILESALDQYSQNREAWRQIFNQGEKWAKELGIKNEEDVDKLIHEFRKEQAKAKSGTCPKLIG